MTDTQAAAFFDLDRTLIAGASTFIFGWVAYRQGHIPTSDLVRDARQAIIFRLTGGSDDQSDMVRDRILEAVAGRSQADTLALNDLILPRLLSEVRPETRRAVEKHREAGRDTWIVSASPVEIVRPLADALGMTGAIATESEVVDGVYTGHLAKAFVYGEGKVERIRDLADERGYDLRLCYAYSDSASDLPMLEVVGHPVAVNPDRELLRVARRSNWPVVHFAQQTKRGITIGTSIAGSAGLAVGMYALGRRHGRRLR
ncbi:MAG: HAD-IB family hydrolase [Acidimicrobiia bacterium]